jgi:hypothetical protein
VVLDEKSSERNQKKTKLAAPLLVREFRTVYWFKIFHKNTFEGSDRCRSVREHLLQSSAAARRSKAIVLLPATLRHKNT